VDLCPTVVFEEIELLEGILQNLHPTRHDVAGVPLLRGLNEEVGEKPALDAANALRASAELHEPSPVPLKQPIPVAVPSTE
jgi:hypothetical protein